jgi:hypothetical protein
VVAQQGETLLELMRRLHLDDQRLSCRPLVAKIAGEIFTLNYVPVRQQENDPDRPSIRRAMAASGGEIRLLRYADAPGREAYIRTAQFVIFLAFHQLWPDALVKMNCTVGSSVYLQVSDAVDFDVSRLKQQIADIVAQDIQLLRRRVKLEDAIANLEANTAKVTAMRDKLIAGLSQIPHSALNGDAVNRLPGNVSFCFEGIEGESLLLLLDAKGVCASSGSACTSGSLDPSHVLLAIGRVHDVAHGSLRLSVCEYNTDEEIDHILTVVPQVVSYLRSISPVWRDLQTGKREYIL